MSEVERSVRFCESTFGAAVMDRETAYVDDHVAADDVILDVGCGIGSLEERLPGHEVVGLDRSPAMLRTARERVDAAFLRGDARSLPVDTGTVDAVVFVATLSFVPDVDAALSEAVRVLDPAGTLIALLLNTRSDYVRSRLSREDSYLQRMVHRDSEQLAAVVLDAVDGSKEYILGVEDETVVERNDPGAAAITAVVGTPARSHSRT